MQGTVLKSRFRIDSFLEETEKSYVFSGTLLGEPDPDLGDSQAIVVKILKDRFANRPGFLERYTQELKATIALPGNRLLVRYLDVDLVGKRFCIVSARCQGVSLGGVVDRRITLGYRPLLEVIGGLGTILEFAARSGLEERHIRLEDVLVSTATGELKLLKFSIPRSARVGARMRKGSVDGDLLFLGSTLYRLVCHGYPTDRWEVPAEVSRQTLASRLQECYPADLSPEEVVRVSNLFLSLSARKPQDRIPSLEAFQEEIRELTRINRNIQEALRRRESWEERKERAASLDTAFDTVAALRGELRPLAPEAGPEDVLPAQSSPARGAGGRPVPVLGAAPESTLEEHRALLWARSDGQFAHVIANWDSPGVVAMLTGMGMLLFLITLLKLVF